MMFILLFLVDPTLFRAQHFTYLISAINNHMLLLLCFVTHCLIVYLFIKFCLNYFRKKKVNGKLDKIAVFYAEIIIEKKLIEK